MGQCDLRSVNLIDLFGIKGNCLRTGRSRSLCLLIRRMKKQTVVIMEAYYFCQLHTQFFSNNLLSRLTLYAGEITGDHQCQLRRNRPTTDHVFRIRQILLASQEGISSLELCSRTFALYETDWMS